jgi:uncharacterized protein YndB with AHSA1/START domain
MTQNPITVDIVVNAPIEKVWEYWNNPIHIIGWAFASDDWEAPKAENDLKVGGKFVTTMAAKDKSVSFDFGGTYTNIAKYEIIEYDMDQALGEGVVRKVKVVFNEVPEGVRIIETFDPENINSTEMQHSGWQAILENFKKYTESH